MDGLPKPISEFPGTKLTPTVTFQLSVFSGLSGCRPLLIAKDIPAFGAVNVGSQLSTPVDSKGDSSFRSSPPAYSM
jgi:hypothetical protein